MFTHARVWVTDILDQVHVEATITQHDFANSLVGESITVVCDVPSEGQTEPREWLRDALVAMAETL